MAGSLRRLCSYNSEVNGLGAFTARNTEIFTVESMLTQRAPLLLEELLFVILGLGPRRSGKIRASSPTGSPKFSSAAATVMVAKLRRSA
jgi:hypothetical protein